MKERGMLFQAPMIRALNRAVNPKTQTRRLRGLDEINQEPDYWRYDGEIRPQIHQFVNLGGAVREIKCPYGVVGDGLWARETWSNSALSVYPCPSAWYRADFDRFDDPSLDPDHGCPKEYQDKNSSKYGKFADCFACASLREGRFRWKPSIHMPRRISRITREITEIRVPRLNSISEDDAVAEGIETPCVPDFMPCLVEEISRPYACAYAGLWEEINGIGSWVVNPHVWALSLRSTR